MKYPDTYTKRKNMLRYTAHLRAMDQSMLDHENYKKNLAAFKATPQHKKFEARQKLLQKLDENNRKNNPNNRIANTREFMLNTLECIYNEINALDKPLTDEEASTFMYNYRVHYYDILIKFDNEVEFDAEQGYTKDLHIEFLEKLDLIDARLKNFFVKTDTAETTI